MRVSTLFVLVVGLVAVNAIENKPSDQQTEGAAKVVKREPPPPSAPVYGAPAAIVQKQAFKTSGPIGYSNSIPAAAIRNVETVGVTKTITPVVTKTTTYNTHSEPALSIGHVQGYSQTAVGQPKIAPVQFNTQYTTYANPTVGVNGPVTYTGPAVAQGWGAPAVAVAAPVSNGWGQPAPALVSSGGWGQPAPVAVVASNGWGQPAPVSYGWGPSAAGSVKYASYAPVPSGSMKYASYAPVPVASGSMKYASYAPVPMNYQGHQGQPVAMNYQGPQGQYSFAVPVYTTNTNLGSKVIQTQSYAAPSITVSSKQQQQRH